MRNIKLRAWNKSGKKWDYFTLDNILTYSKTLNLHLLFGDEFYLFTGLHDRNGKEIWEGDIVKWDDRSKGEYWRVAVVEIDPDIQFRIVKNSLHELSAREGVIFRFGSFAYQDTHHHLDVIGNIYEHTELLQEVAK